MAVKNVIILIMILFPSLAFAQPSIRFDAETHDFGVVAQGNVEHIFEFENGGTEDLEIGPLKPS